jgi:hypothetical protein
MRNLACVAGNDISMIVDTKYFRKWKALIKYIQTKMLLNIDRVTVSFRTWQWYP